MCFVTLCLVTLTFVDNDVYMYLTCADVDVATDKENIYFVHASAKSATSEVLKVKFVW